MENSNSNYPTYLCQVNKVKTPDFKYRIANGLPLPENPYSLVILRSPPARVYGQYEYPTYVDHEKNYTRFPLVDRTGWSDKERRALEASWRSTLNNKCLEKVKAMSLPLIQMYLERKKTASALAKLVDDSLFIARYAFRPNKIFKKFGLNRSSRRASVIRKKINRLRKEGDVGSLWLQYRMFLTPGYHDVVACLNAAADYEKKGITTSVTSSAKFKESLDFKNDTSSYLVPTNRKKGVLSVKGGAKMRIRYSVTDTSLQAITTLADPLATAWDLVPWSFIVDRFADISSYLELRNATLGTTFRSGSLSYKFEWDGKAEVPWVQTYYPNRLLWKVAIGGYKYEIYGTENSSMYELSTGRIILTAFPPVQFEYPFRQGWKQITDQIVLLRQILNKRKIRSLQEIDQYG